MSIYFEVSDILVYIIPKPLLFKNSKKTPIFQHYKLNIIKTIQLHAT